MTADMNFFHGATPWLYIESKAPYFAYLDACFATYINVYHDIEDFSKKQIETLFKLEAQFLGDASAVFFSSRWALEDAKQRYQLMGNNFHYSGLGGGLEDVITNNRDKNEETYLLFISWDFLGKRGDKLVSAFNRIQNVKNLRLKIIGQKPPQKVLEHPGIDYLGALNKNNPRDMDQLRLAFKNAYCFVLPSSKDMTPLVLVEAASMGCPVISINNFGIPEIVVDGQTGLLIESDQATIEDNLFDSIHWLLQNKEERDRMGIQAKQRIQEFFTWEGVGEKIINILNKY